MRCVIYKYEVYPRDKYSDDLCVAAPDNFKIIRVEHVNDDSYNGLFCWGILDLDNVGAAHNFIIDESLNINRYFSDFNYVLPLKTQSDFTLPAGIVPVYVQNDNGYMKIYCKKLESYGVVSTKKPLVTYDIIMVKTGQIIDVDLMSMQYLGILKIIVGQELGLYVFAKERES